MKTLEECIIRVVEYFLKETIKKQFLENLT